MNISQNKNKWIIIGSILFVLLFVITIFFSVFLSRQKITAIQASKLTDQAWEAVTPVVDQGGVGMVSPLGNKKESYLVIGRGQTRSGEDYRNCTIKIDERYENGEKILLIKLADPSSVMNEKGWSPINPSNRPVAVYKFKNKGANVIELEIDGKKTAFTNIVNNINKFIK